MRSKSVALCLLGMLMFVHSLTAAEMRKWTPRNGEPFEAELCKVRKGNEGGFLFTLRKADGTETTVSGKDLSRDDLKYLLETARAKRQPEKQDEKRATTSPAASSSPLQRGARSQRKSSWSTSIAMTPDGGELWAVNEDNDSVTALKVLDKPPFLEKVSEILVGLAPRALAISPDGNTVYVTNQHSSSLTVIDRAQKNVLGFVGLGWASQPWGVVASPDGRFVYVTTCATAKVHQVDVTDRQHCRIVKSVPVAGRPWAIAITADGGRLFVTEGINAGAFQSRDGAKVTRVDTQTFATKVIRLGKDNTRDTGGYISMLRSIAIMPQGDRAVVACQYLDSDRGQTRDRKSSLSFKTEIQPVLCFLDLNEEAEIRSSRIVMSQLGAVINTPSALDFLTVKRRVCVFVAAQGSDDVKVIGLTDEQPTERALVRVGGISGKWPTGAAPDGVSVDAARNRAYVLNFLNRSVSVLGLVDPLIDTKELAEVRTVETERLPPPVYFGKKFFYSSEYGTSTDSWISCANCHPDGGTDGRVWDFSQFGGHRGEKARTLSLQGTTGYRARLFWAGRADEVQDLENGVRMIFGGKLIPGDPNQNLGKSNSGRGRRFDAVTAYITSLQRVQPSPFRAENGQLTDAAKMGRALFYGEAGCASCHRPECRFSNTSRSKPRRFEPEDVGTGGAFNVPCLVGTWENGTWMHDGRATHLRDSLTGNKMLRSDMGRTAIDHLTAFVEAIDEGGDVRSATGACRNNRCES